MKINISFIFGLLLIFSFNLKGQITTQEIKQRNNILNIEAFDQPYLSDIDGDNDLDILTTQEVSGTDYLFTLKNDGKGNYSKAVQTSIEHHRSYSRIYFLDINGDNAQDILITELYSQTTSQSTVYLNDGNGNYSVYQTNIPKGFHAVRDLNKDGKEDFLAGEIIEHGEYNFTHMVWYFYYNDHNNSQQFIKQPIDTFLVSHNLSARDLNSIILEDFDKNGFHDILLVGKQISKIPGDGNGTGATTHSAALFLNDSNKTLTWSDELVADESPVEWGDYQGYAADFNGDGHLDLLRGDQYNGSEEDDSSKIVLHFNNGKGEFSRQNTPVFFEKLQHPQYAVFDVDNDGDSDIVYSGSVREEIKPEYVNQYGRHLLMVYINDGKGNFSYLRSYNFVGGKSGSNKLTAGDIDGDGYQDIISEDHAFQGQLSIFRNEAGNGFKYFYDDSIYACPKSAVLVEDLDNDNLLDIFHKTPYLINKQGEAFSYPSRSEFCNETPLNEALIDYNGDGRKEHVSLWGNEWSPGKHLSLDSNYTNGILSSTKVRYSALSTIESEVTMLSSGKINQNDQEDIIYVTDDMKVKMAEYDSQSNDFIITDLFTITESIEIKEFQLINFDYDQTLIIWGTDPSTYEDEILVYDNRNGNFEKNTGYVALVSENNDYLNKCKVKDIFGVAEYLFTESSNEKGLKSYQYSGDYGTEYSEFSGQEVHHAAMGSFSNDNYNKWIAVLYRDPNDNQVKVALSYESTVYNIDEINQFFSFEESSDWGPTPVIGSLQTIDIGNDGTTELIVNAAAKDGTYQLKIFEIRLNPVTGTPYVKKDGFTIYPNPAVEYVNVNLEESVELLTVEVKSLDGKTLSSQKFKNTDVATISLNRLSSGCYIISVISSHKAFSKKIIKK